MKLLILNGPNLNFLGIREKSIYGAQDYKDLEKYIDDLSKEYDFEYEIKQSNCEGTIIDYLQEAYFNKSDGVVINAGAYTHYSYAIRDAIASIKIPTVEVHLSDITKREEFRKISVIKEVCVASYFGKHFESYKDGILHILKSSAE